MIFDKSFLQMLNPEELSELSIYFKFVGTPLLVREIIADLKKRPEKRQVSGHVVRALASKMWSAHGIQPADFRKLGIANLCALYDVPMIGQVPVDPAASNVHTIDGGKGLVYDSTPEQQMWQRWADGNFTTADELAATAWRRGVQSINLHAVGQHWKEFTTIQFAQTKNIPTLIDRANEMLDSFDKDEQFSLLMILMALLDVSIPASAWATRLFSSGLMPRIKDLAPYSASILRLYLVFIGGLGRGFIGPRPSHYVDLQYLFYAPFCMVFVSSDKFHRELWPATSGVNTFIWGPDLKLELAKRISIQAEMNEQQKEVRGYPFFPPEIENSLIRQVWEKYIRLPLKGFNPKKADGSPKTIDDLEPHIRRHLREVEQALEGRRAKQQEDVGAANDYTSKQADEADGQ